MLDYQALLYDPIYDTLGIAATIKSGKTSLSFDLTAIDKTSGVAVTEDQNSNIQTILPAAFIRAREMTSLGLSKDDLNGGILTLKPDNLPSSSWKITSHRPDPSPKGEQDGQYYLFLQEIR